MPFFILALLTALLGILTTVLILCDHLYWEDNRVFSKKYNRDRCNYVPFLKEDANIYDVEPIEDSPVNNLCNPWFSDLETDVDYDIFGI